MEVLLEMLNYIHSVKYDECINKVASFLYEREFYMAIDNIPFTESNRFKIYSLVTMEGSVDWVTIKVKDIYYSVNIRAIKPYEEQIVITNTEKEMIQKFMAVYNSNKRACTLTINGEYEAINTKITIGKILCESASDYIFKPTFEDDVRENFLYDEVNRIEKISDDDPKLLYTLFEFAKEFRPELTHVFLEYNALKDNAIHAEYMKQSAEFLLKNGVQEYNYTMLDVYHRLLKEANC